MNGNKCFQGYNQGCRYRIKEGGGYTNLAKPIHILSEEVTFKLKHGE